MNGNLLRDAVISGANNLNNNRAYVDSLNVFPVPDGDTGTNMGMTITAARDELSLLDGADIGEVASVCASALLRGARGNSGVILSLLFRGFAKGLAGKKEADITELSAALWPVSINRSFIHRRRKTREGGVFTLLFTACRFLAWCEQ